jgi:hypothetical protein
VIYPDRTNPITKPEREEKKKEKRGKKEKSPQCGLVHRFYVNRHHTWDIFGSTGRS